MSIVKMRESFSKSSKFILIFIAGTFVIGGVYVGFGQSMMGRGGPAGQESNLIAKVNGDKITRQQYANLLQIREDYYRQMNAGNSAVQEISLRGEVLALLIENRLRVQAAEEEGIGVGRRDVSREIDKLVEERLDNLRKQVLGEGQKKSPATDRLLDRRLRQSNTPTSLSQQTKLYRSQFPRDQVWEMLMIRKLEDKVRKGVTLSDEQLRSRLKEVTARHILISTTARPEAQAKRRAEEILKEAKAGADFAALAKQFSEDRGSKDEGGLLPTFSYGTMVPEFEKAAFALQPGQVSDLVKTRFGYHIIKVEKSELKVPPDFEAKKKQYRDQVLLQQRNRAVAEYSDKLRDKAKIEIYDPMLKGYWAMRNTERFRADNIAYQQKLAEAERQLNIALRKTTEENSDYWMTMVLLSQVYAEAGKKDKAIKMLRIVFDRSLTESADLRIMLGQLYLETGDKQRALESFLEAAEVGYPDYTVHSQLQELFAQLGRSDLANKEKQWLDDYTKRLKILQQQGGAPGVPMPGRVPPPPPGG